MDHEFNTAHRIMKQKKKIQENSTSRWDMEPTTTFFLRQNRRYNIHAEDSAIALKKKGAQHLF